MNLTPKSPDEPDLEFIYRVAEWLGEHYDCVQIFAHSSDPFGGIDAYNAGTGNLWARERQVSLWLNGESGDDEEEIEA